MARKKAAGPRQKSATKTRKDSNISSASSEGEVAAPQGTAATATAVTDFFKSMNNSVRNVLLLLLLLFN